MQKLLLIAGSGRSGTTWVLDSLADANQLRPIFEPLHPESNKIAHQLAYSYLTREDDHTELKRYISAVASNALDSIWTDYRIRPSRLSLSGQRLRSAAEFKRYLRTWATLIRRRRTYSAKKCRDGVLVKCIRANLMLDWITANFEAKIVLLMRHPCAVVESQLRFAEHWDPYGLLARYRDDPGLMSGPLRNQYTVLDQTFSRPEALAAVWCIENLVPALQAAKNGYQVVFYEELLENPEAEWQRIATALDISLIPGPVLLKQPSQQAAVRLQKQEAADGNYSERYSTWRKSLSKEILDQVSTVLNCFGIDFYSVSRSRPDIDLFKRLFLPQ